MRPLPVLLALAVIAVGCSREPEPGDSTNQKNGGVTMQHPADLADQAGVPVYPNAQMPNGKSSILDKGTEIKYEILMTTSDTPDKVQEFYKTKLQRAQAMPASHAVMGMGANGSLVSVTATQNGEKTEIRAVSVVEKTK